MIIQKLQVNLSKVTGIFANLWIFPPLRSVIYKIFSKCVGLRWQDAEKPLTHYKSINHFFTRTLHPNLRPISNADLITPVDGTLIQSGAVNSGDILQAKGLSYSVSQLLNSQPHEIPDSLKHFRTYYLSPKDCHLIFSPCTATVEKIDHIRGYRYPVREPYISQHPNLYSQNERKNIWLNDKGRIIVLSLISAFNVGDIESTVTEGETIDKGQVVGKFKLGSSVVLLGDLPKSTATLPLEITYGSQLI